MIRSQFVQNLLLATLAPDFDPEDIEKDEKDDPKPDVSNASKADSDNGNEPDLAAEFQELDLNDSRTSTTTQSQQQSPTQNQTQSGNSATQSSNDASKKKQDTGSHTDYDSHPNSQHMSRMLIKHQN